MTRFRSLASRLVLTAVGLVAVVSLLLGTTTTLAMRTWFTHRLDSDVSAAMSRVTRFVQLERGYDGDPRVVPPGSTFSGDGPGDVRGQQVGTLTAYLTSSDESGSVIRATDDGATQVAALSADVLNRLDALNADQPRTVSLPELGRYRVLTGHTPDGIEVVVGLPTEDVDDATTSLIGWEITLALLGTIVAGLVASSLVRRQLRPLTEVAATAHAVTGQRLDAGDIGIMERVPDHLTDEHTEVGQVGAALNQLLEHVESSLAVRHRSEQQVRQFVADASHELRTPLTTIAGYTELARRRPDAETAAVALAKVEEESGRMTALVEDLLLLARLDAGRPLAAAPVDLTRLLLEAVDDARVVAPDHRWQFEQPEDAGEGPVEVTGDPQRLHQVITNLLANARKHTPAGTTVTVTVQPGGFVVRDDGPGFPPDLAATAFERFTRGDAARHRSDGVGLGLALVQAIVAAHGGSVALDSRRGDTRIEVHLGSQADHR